MAPSLAQSRVAIPLLLLVGGLGPLGAAWFTQYVLHYPPCPLCMWQRYPYALPVLAGLLALLPRLRQARWLLLIGALGWFVTAGIAAYHVGIEQGWIVHESGCTAKALGGSLEDIRAQLMAAPLVACNTVSFRLLGLSMAHWNLASGLALGVMALSLRRQMRPA